MSRPSAICLCPRFGGAWILAAAALLSAALAAPSCAAPAALRVGAGNAVQAEDRFEPVRARIRATLEEREIPSVAVAVARTGEIIWEEGFGWADRERRIPATAHTPYSVASISKPITATAIMRLVEAGELELDRPANHYLGAGQLVVPGSGRRESEAAGATVRRLLSHTAGLPLHYQFFYDGSGYEPPGMDETITRYGILVHPPGEVYQYSNLGYGVLDHIITRVTGRDWADFLESEVFRPLGMTRASVHLPPELEPYAATRYDGGRRPIPFYGFDHAGASAIWSSAHDLVRFGMFHLGDLDTPDVLSRRSIREMQRLATPPDADRGYGLGWILDEDRGFRRVYHTGGMPGVSAILALYPAERLVVAVLTNSSDRIVFEVAEAIVEAVLPRYRAAGSAADAGPRPGGGRAARPSSGDGRRGGSGGSRAGLVGTWEGALHTYEGRVPMRLEVRRDGEVRVRLAGQLEALLNFALVERHRIAGRFAATIPTTDARRHVHSVLLDLRLRDGRLSGPATAQTTEEPIHFALTSFVELERTDR